NPFQTSRARLLSRRRALFTAEAGSSRCPLKAKSLCKPRTSTWTSPPSILISTMLLPCARDGHGVKHSREPVVRDAAELAFETGRLTGDTRAFGFRVSGLWAAECGAKPARPTQLAPAPSSVLASDPQRARDR